METSSFSVWNILALIWLSGAVLLLTGGAAALFVLFYPVLVGIPYPTWYGACVLKWFPAWPF